ncbi:hypothetical protein NDU88_000501 [Pleurodeles waltl]|uniref:Uncharacterized protein n=1 Tax=Pleurodeles waltl TaxID=8319 RepID=A0AAV7P124_PLEWA|nr:hypothetical protein NDU88_000501 [Pleurodeles waltl]
MAMLAFELTRQAGVRQVKRPRKLWSGGDGRLCRSDLYLCVAVKNSVEHWNLLMSENGDQLFPKRNKCTGPD